MIDLTTVIQAPVTTEKSVGTKGTATFLVHPKANKTLVAQAVLTFYKQKAEGVRIINLPAKYRQTKYGKSQKRAEGKKAVVKLAAGQSINFNDFK